MISIVIPIIEAVTALIAGVAALVKIIVPFFKKPIRLRRTKKIAGDTAKKK